MRLPIRRAVLVAAASAAFAAVVVLGLLFVGGEESAKPASIVPAMTNDELLADLGAPVAEQRGCPVPGGEDLQAYAYVREEHQRVEIICVPPVEAGPEG